MPRPTLSPILLATVLALVACDHAGGTAATSTTTTTPEVSPNGELVEVWSTELRGDLPQQVLPDAAGRSALYVAAKDGGLVVLDEGGSVVDRIGSDAFAGLDVMSVAQRGDLLVAALGDFFGQSSPAGLATIDVGDPAAPTVLGVWRSPDDQQGAPAVVVDEAGATAYLGLMSHGVAAIDVRDPSMPKLISTFRPDPNFPRENPGAVAIPNARGLDLVDNLLYVAYDAGGLRIVDVTDPAAMTEVGRHINPDATKQQAYNDVLVDGDVLYASLDYCGFEAVDVADTTEPRQISWLDPWDCNSIGNLWFNSPGHTNQVHLDAGRRLVWVSAGDSELLAVDVTDPAAPAVAASYGGPGNDRGTYGLGATGDTIYLSYIVTVVPFQGRWSGITALRVGSAR